MGPLPRHLDHDVLLAGHTTIGLGGPARYFLRATTLEHLREALVWARAEKLPVHILGGGSNTIFADEGFPGLVLQVGLRGIDFREEEGSILATVAAGEPWDDFVATCVERGLGGLECLSGIPGSAGATPVQNVGAYGQEVGETIVGLTALDRENLEEIYFTGAECAFSYRRSRFKGADRGRYVITAVTYRLTPEGRPALRYPELRGCLERRGDIETLGCGQPALAAVRAAVLELRRAKSMLFDPADPHSRSVGSFFLNPILPPAQRAGLEQRWQALGGTEPVPFFDSIEGIKVPAAWLVERAGFGKGYRRGGVGVSARHCLALVNYGGTTRELLALAEEIREGVYARFGVLLEIEPDIVPDRDGDREGDRDGDRERRPL